MSRPSESHQTSRLRWPSRSDPSPTEYYHLAVSYRPAPHAELHQAEIARFTDPDLGPVIAYDAAQDPEACRVILNALLGGRRLRSPDSEARFNTAAIRLERRPGATHVHRAAEQHLGHAGRVRPS